MIRGNRREIAGLEASALLLSAPESPPSLLFGRLEAARSIASTLFARPIALATARACASVLTGTVEI